MKYTGKSVLAALYCGIKLSLDYTSVHNLRLKYCWFKTSIQMNTTKAEYNSKGSRKCNAKAIWLIQQYQFTILYETHCNL